MILGIDIGNSAAKSSKEIIFPSKCSRTGNILKNTSIETNEGTFYIGEGTYDTEYRKIKKEFLKPLFLYAVAMSSEQLKPQPNTVVVGLPLSQYKQDKDTLRDILFAKVNDISVNGVPRRIVIDDIAVYPEGLGAIAGTEFEGILCDIGGRSTDVLEIINNGNSKKVNNAFSITKGTLNLNSDFIKLLNSKGLDLRVDDAERILRNGLKIDGVTVDISGAMEVFKAYVNELVNSLQLEYSLQTSNVILVGGGSQLLYQAIKNRIPAAMIISNPVFANAIGFAKVGCQLWS